jgi:hypothetical protein
MSVSEFEPGGVTPPQRRAKRAAGPPHEGEV